MAADWAPPGSSISEIDVAPGGAKRISERVGRALLWMREQEPERRFTRPDAVLFL